MRLFTITKVYVAAIVYSDAKNNYAARGVVFDCLSAPAPIFLLNYPHITSLIRDYIVICKIIKIIPKKLKRG